LAFSTALFGCFAFALCIFLAEMSGGGDFTIVPQCRAMFTLATFTLHGNPLHPAPQTLAQ